MQYPDDFAHYSFLSKETEALHARDHVEFSAYFQEVRELVRVALAEIFAVPKRARKGAVAGLVLWIRSVEAAQAATILIDRGMPGPAMASARLAWECLFYAGSLWEDPGREDKLDQVHENHRLTQAAAIVEKSGNKLLSEQVEELQVLLMGPHENKRGGWKVEDAAREAGFQTQFDIHFRGLSGAGSHATSRSLDRHMDRSTGELFINAQPDFREVRLVLMTVAHCLTTASRSFASGRPLTSVDHPIQDDRPDLSVICRADAHIGTSRHHHLVLADA